MVKKTLGILIATLLWSGAHAADMQLLDRVVAVVNDDVILASELEAEIRNIRNRLEGQGVNLPPEQILRQQVLQRMVSRELQLQLAERAGIRITDDMVNQTMAGIAQRNGVSLSELPALLKKDGIDYADYREQVREEMTINTVQRLDVYDRINVTDREIDQYLARQDAASNVEYKYADILVSVPASPQPEELEVRRKRAEQIAGLLANGENFAQTAVAYSDAQNALSGEEAQWQSAAQLPGPFAAALANMEPGDISPILRGAGGFHILKLLDVRRGTSQSNVVTQTHARHILIKTNPVVSDADARRKLEDLRKKLEEGASFEELAREHSDDTGSASQGGDLGWATPGTYAPEFEKVLDGLSAGEISQPFQTRFGWHLVELLDRRTRDIGLELRRDEARQAIKRRKFEEQLPTWQQRMWDEAYLEFHIPGMQGLENR